MRTHKLSGDPQILVRINDTRAVLHRLKHEGKDTTECEEWLEKAEKIFKRWRLIQYPAYDRIWQMLHRIRHVLCRIGSISELLWAAVDIRGCLSYVTKEERESYQGYLGRIEESLRLLLPKHGAEKHSHLLHLEEIRFDGDIKGSFSPLIKEEMERNRGDPAKIEGSFRLHLPKQEGDKHLQALSMEEIRFDLEYLSMLTADARDAHWRKVNLLRTRLVYTAWILGALLASSLWLVPEFLNKAKVDWIFILAIIALGAVGGLVSAILTTESLEAPSHAFYIRRILLFLKPLIGAAGGLILYLVQVSGVITIVSTSSNQQATYLVLAFVAGFSERFFVSEVEQVAGLGKKKKKQKEAGE